MQILLIVLKNLLSLTYGSYIMIGEGRMLKVSVGAVLPRLFCFFFSPPSPTVAPEATLQELTDQ